MKKKIAVVTGGNSSEYVISVKSADTIIENLDPGLFDTYRVEVKGDEWFVTAQSLECRYDIDKSDFTFIIDGEKQHFDLALIMIHGTPGEDGLLQGYFDTLGIPYTASGVLASSATFNKHFTKAYLKSYDIQSADWLLINKTDRVDQKLIEEQIGFPCFVKPNNAGSSFGVTKVYNQDQLHKAIHDALKEDDEVLIEKMIEGTEITCGVLRTDKNFYAFPVTEIVSKTGFFDFEAKYTDGMADEIIPARIPDEVAKECQELSKKIYSLFNCRWFARVDYIWSEGILYLLEINTIPGMSKESIIPKMVRAEGLTLKGLLTEIIKVGKVN